MTYLPKARRWLQLAASLVIAGCGLFAVPAHALTVTLGTGCTAGSTTYTYSTISVASNGDVTVTCGAGTPQPGTIAFNPTSYSVNAGATNTRDVTLTRTGGSAGAAGANLSMTGGGCGIAPTSVSWADNDSAAKTVTVTATPGPTTCTLTGSTTTTAGSNTITASISVIDASVANFALAAPTSAPVAGGSAVNIVVNRTGNAGVHSIAYSATAQGLTGATLGGQPLVNGTPLAGSVAFGAADNSMSLSFAPGTTAGSLTVTLGAATPPAGASVNAAPLAVTVSGGTPTGCPTTPPTDSVNMVEFTTEGAFAQQRLGNGIIGYARLPALPAGVLGAQITLTPIQVSGDIQTVELGLSPCPGDIRYGARPTLPGGGGGNQANFNSYPCHMAPTSNLNNVPVSWHLTVPGHYAFCYAPASEIWYVNIRYVVPGCTYGTGNCGMYSQWNRR